MAAAAAAAIGSAGSNLLGSLGTAGIQAATSMKLQSNEQEFNTGVMNRAENAFSSAGLPKFMAYTGNSGSGGLHLPGQQFQVRGGNYASAGLVGQNVPFISTPMQSYTQTGRPNGGSAIRPWNEIQKENEMGELSRFPSQNDRMGLGYGRYFMRGGIINQPTTSRALATHVAARQALGGAS